MDRWTSAKLVGFRGVLLFAPLEGETGVFTGTFKVPQLWEVPVLDKCHCITATLKMSLTVGHCQVRLVF